MVISIVTIILSFLSFIPSANGSKNGIVGFGISLYQDLCCQACHDSLSALYLTCTTFDEGDMPGMAMGDMMMMGTTSDECYASNTAWLQTMAYCIQQNCKADGYPASKQAQCFSTQAVAGASKPTFQESLPVTAPTVELAEDAVWLNVTSLVNANVYYSTHGTLGEFARSEYFHTRYAVILYLIVIGICITCGILAQAASVLPGFQRHLQTSAVWSKLKGSIFLPALFDTRRLEPLPGSVGYLPGRALSIFIGAYIALNIIFSAVSFRNFQPNVWFLSPQFELCEYVGNRTGTLSLVNMSIAILFAGRNNLLIMLTGWTRTTFLTLHRWTARVAALQAVVHSICYTLAYFQPGYEGAKAYAAKAAESFYWWGIIATIALCLAAAFAFLPLRRNFYETFLILHIVLVILALIGCWYHLVPHFGYDYGYQVWLYICFAFWSADRLARLVRVGYYNRFGKSKAFVEAVPDCDIMQVTIFPRVTWGFGPGQHSFLYLPGLGKFWESHPFSVAGWRIPGQSLPAAAATAASKSSHKEANVIEHAVEEPASIRFLIRGHSGITSSLRHRLLSSGSRLELSTLTEGPYAGHRASLHPLYAADTVLCIVGGIGITNVLGYVQEYAAANLHGSGGEIQGRSRNVMKAKRFILAWSAREMALIEHVKQNFLVDVDGLEYLFWCTGSEKSDKRINSVDEKGGSDGLTAGKAAPPKTGRMNIDSVLRDSLEHDHQTAVLVCAPGGMADEVTKQVVSCVKEGFKADLVEETFSW